MTSICSEHQQPDPGCSLCAAHFVWQADMENIAKAIFWCMNSIMHDHNELWAKCDKKNVYFDCARAAHVASGAESRLAIWSAPLANADARKLHTQLVEAQMWMQREEHNGRIKHDPLYSTLYGRAAKEIGRLHKIGEMRPADTPTER